MKIKDLRIEDFNKDNTRYYFEIEFSKLNCSISLNLFGYFFEYSNFDEILDREILVRINWCDYQEGDSAIFESNLSKCSINQALEILKDGFEEFKSTINQY